LYLEVKVRNQSLTVTPESLLQEKEKLRYLDSLDLIEYLRSSIEILLSLNCIDNKEQSNLKKTCRSIHCNTSILNRNIPDDEDGVYCSELLSCSNLSNAAPITTRQSRKEPFLAE